MDSNIKLPIEVERVGLFRTVMQLAWAPFRLLSGPITSLFARFGPDMFSFFRERYASSKMIQLKFVWIILR